MFRRNRRFRAALPEARIYVYDNNSTDGTALKAMLAGATVVRERRQGKGHVVRRMFADIDADIYLMADGDGTYENRSVFADNLDAPYGLAYANNKIYVANQDELVSFDYQEGQTKATGAPTDLAGSIPSARSRR